MSASATMSATMNAASQGARPRPIATTALTSAGAALGPSSAVARPGRPPRARGGARARRARRAAPAAGPHRRCHTPSDPPVRPSPACADANQHRSPKRECPDADNDYHMPAAQQPATSSNKNIGVLGVDHAAPSFADRVLRVHPYPQTQPMSMDVPDEALQSMQGETKTPLDFIAPDEQAAYVPVFNVLLATQVAEGDAEARLLEQARLLEAHKRATDELTNYTQAWARTSWGHSSPPVVLHDNVAASLEAYTRSMQDCTQQQVRPKSIEVVIDASLERIAVSCAVANPTSKCGEMHVSLPAMEGWGYLYSEERVADYPRTETCELKAKAERIYKEANAAANTGASISQNSREMVARSFKCPAGDTAWVTFHFKLADPARCWKQQPVRAAAPGASPRHPKEALEYAIFTPPSDGADAVPFHLRVLRPEDDSLSFALPSSQAVEHEAETRNCGVYYVRTATADGRGAPLTLVGERPLVAEVAFPSPNLPKLLKVRVEREQWDECGDLGDAFNAAVKIQDKPTIKLLAHAPAHHPDVAVSMAGDAVATLRVTMPNVVPKECSATRKPVVKKIVFVGDASGSMGITAPYGSGMTNAQKLDKEIGALGQKLLGLLPFLRKHGLSIPGDRIEASFVRFHSTARVVASNVELTAADAQQQMERAVAAYQACSDSGGTNFCSWLEIVEQMAQQPGDLVVMVGTDGGAHDGGGFFRRLQKLKDSRENTHFIVLAMGAYLDEETARRTQTDGHRLMEEVGPAVPDLGYQLLFKCIVKSMQSMKIRVAAPILSLSGNQSEMPSMGLGLNVPHVVGMTKSVCPGESFVMTVPARYGDANAGTDLQLPPFYLGESTDPGAFEYSVAPALKPDADAVLKQIDALYCSPDVSLVADSAAWLQRAVEGVGLVARKDTTHTKCVATYVYPGDKGVLPATVTVAPPKDLMREGLLSKTQAGYPWMANDAGQRPRATVHVNYAPGCGPDASTVCFRSCGASGLDDNQPQYTSCSGGASGLDDNQPQYTSCSGGASGLDDNQPQYTSCSGGAAAAMPSAPPAKPSARMDVDLKKLPGAEDFLRAACSRVYVHHLTNSNVAMMVLTQLRKFEERLKKKVEAGERAAQFGPGVPMDDAALEAMADAQGDACDDGYLPALAAELRAMVAVLVEQAFATQFRGGVAVYDEHLTERAGALLLRVQYLRSLIEGIAGISCDGANFYRAHLSFSDFEQDATPTQSSFKSTLSWELSPQLYPEDHCMKADVAVGSLVEAAQSASDKLVSEWREHVGISAGGFPGHALVRLIKEPKGFTDETIHVPRYDNNNDGGNAFYTSLSASMSAGADPKFFDPLPKSVGDQVAALVKKHNA